MIKKKFVTLVTLIFIASIFPVSLIGASEGDDWALTIDGESLDLIPELEEYSWILDRPPYTPHDKIALRRLVKSGEEPIGVIFIFPGTWSSGDQLISDDVYCQYLEAIDADEEEIEKLRNMVAEHSICHYLALRGFDVYSIDYRTHFVPNTYTQDDLKFMKNWGWEMYMEDAELSFDKAKEISGEDKLFLGGESFGGMLAMNYASKHWEEDLDGIVLLDGGTGGKPSRTCTMGMLPVPLPIPIGIPFLGLILETIAHLAGMYALDIYEERDDAESQAFIAVTYDRYWPMQIYLEYMADVFRPRYKWDCGIWNRDYFNYYANYKEIDVPLIAFISGFGLDFWGEYNPGIANQDVTGYTYPDWSHHDIYGGTYNDEMVNEPTYQWLLDHL